MTNEVDGGSGHPLDAALCLVHEGLAALADLALWQLDEGQLRVLAAGLDRAGLLAQGQLVRLLGEVDARGLPGQDGTRTSGAWLRWKTCRSRCDPANASRSSVKTARASRR